MADIAGNTTDGTDWEAEGAWKNWPWHQIEAAIAGASEVSSTDSVDTSSYSNPQTLWDAGDAFDSARYTLQNASATLKAYTNSVAGDGRAWSGPGADQFTQTMNSITQQIDRHAELLEAPPAQSASVAQQLVDAGNKLSTASAQVHAIDSYYANAAVQRGAGTVNGLVQIHEVPGLGDQMTSDMRTVMSGLVDHYQVTKGTAVAAAPPSVDGPSNTGGNTVNGPGDVGGLTSGYNGPGGLGGDTDGGAGAGGFDANGFNPNGVDANGAHGHSTSEGFRADGSGAGGLGPDSYGALHAPLGSDGAGLHGAGVNDGGVPPYTGSLAGQGAHHASLADPSALGLPPSASSGYSSFEFATRRRRSDEGIIWKSTIGPRCDTNQK